MVTLLSLLAVLLLPATLAEDCKDGACSKEKGKVPGVLLMQTKPGSLLKSASSIPDISTVLKQQMDTMMSSVQAVQTKVQSCCSCDKVTDTFNRENTGICAVFGDPHFVTFDGAQTTLVGDHVTWLVKTDQMHLQTLEKGSEGFLMGFAAGGPFLQGHRLVVFKDSEHGPVHVTFDGTEILQAEVDEFHNSEVGVSAYRRENWDPELFDDRILNLRTKMPFTIGDFEDRFKNLVTTGVYLITLPNQLHVTITGVDFLSLVISMPKQGGETGYCGNFNGDPDDDAEPVVPQWDKPVGPNLEDLPPAQRLFSNETVLLLLGEEAVRTEARSEEEEMKHKLKRVTECPKVLLQKAEEACSGLTEAYHKFCVFDVCLSQNLASAKSVSAAAVIQHKMNARGVPIFMGHGRCMDSQGRGYFSYPTKLRTDTACQQVLRTLSLTDGVMGAQLKRGGFCEVLTMKEVDPTNVAIPGGWGLPAQPTPEEDVQIAMAPEVVRASAAKNAAHEAEAVEGQNVEGDGTGVIAGATDEASYNCWQLN